MEYLILGADPSMGICPASACTLGDCTCYQGDYTCTCNSGNNPCSCNASKNPCTCNTGNNPCSCNAGNNVCVLCVPFSACGGTGGLGGTIGANSNVFNS